MKQLSTVIREAVADAKEFTAVGGRLNMSSWVTGTDEICTACLGGVWLIGRTGVKKTDDFYKFLYNNRDLEKQLDALNNIRCGTVKGAFYNYYDEQVPKGSELNAEPRPIFCDYRSYINEAELNQFFGAMLVRADLIETWERKYL